MPYNLATNFREAVAENLRDVFLGQGHFEENVEWYKTAATTSPIVLKVLLSNVNGKRDQEAHHLADARTFVCVVPKNPVVMEDGEAVLWSSLFDEPFAPKLGNWMVRNDGSVNGSRWAWSHVQDEGSASWTLVFTGGRLERVGFGKPNSL